MKPRFKVGDKVWIRDKAAPKGDDYAGYVRIRGGYRIVGPVTVQDVHLHPGREPFYPHGEGYAFNYRGVGSQKDHDAQPGLWWDCYPGCRVFATREEATEARLTREWVENRFYGQHP